MAYVVPTEEGKNIFEKHGSLWDKIVVYAAGVRNNFLVGLIILFFLQILGCTRGNLSVQELVETAMITPFKILFLFFSFLVGCITCGRVNWTEKFLLSTGGVEPPDPLKQIIIWNLTLGIFNLAPIPLFDGGHVVQAILLSAESHINMPHIPNFVGFILFIAFFTAASKVDMRILEIEPRLEEIQENIENIRKKKRSKGSLGRWEEEGEKAPNFLLESSISYRLSTYVNNLLRNSGINTVGELREYTVNQLLQIKGFGSGSLAEVKALLSEKDLSLKPESKTI